MGVPHCAAVQRDQLLRSGSPLLVDGPPLPPSRTPGDGWDRGADRIRHTGAGFALRTLWGGGKCHLPESGTTPGWWRFGFLIENDPFRAMHSTAQCSNLNTQSKGCLPCLPRPPGIRKGSPKREACAGGGELPGGGLLRLLRCLIAAGGPGQGPPAGVGGGEAGNVLDMGLWPKIVLPPRGGVERKGPKKKSEGTEQNPPKQVLRQNF